MTHSGFEDEAAAKGHKDNGSSAKSVEGNHDLT
jgi:hypothetical protein